MINKDCIIYKFRKLTLLSFLIIKLTYICFFYVEKSHVIKIKRDNFIYYNTSINIVSESYNVQVQCTFKIC